MLLLLYNVVMISNMLHRKPSRASYITEFSVFLSKLRPFPQRQFNHRFKETPEGASNVTQGKEEVTGMKVVQLPLELVDENDFKTHHPRIPHHNGQKLQKKVLSRIIV